MSGVDPVKMAEEMMAEVQANSRGAIALADALLTGPTFMTDEDAMEAFECGVVAGYTETMRMLMRRGLLPGSEAR